MSASTHHPLTNCQPARRPAGFSLARVAAWFERLARRRRERIADRAALAWMDERDLRDARLTRWEFEQEMARPFWRD